MPPVIASAAPDTIVYEFNDGSNVVAKDIYYPPAIDGISGIPVYTALIGNTGTNNSGTFVQAGGTHPPGATDFMSNYIIERQPNGDETGLIGMPFPVTKFVEPPHYDGPAENGGI